VSAAAPFRAAVERWDIEAISGLLAEDVVFHSPVTFHPYVGREDELTVDGAEALVFRANVGDRELEGIDLLRFNEGGLIEDFTVFVRPLSGLVPFAQAMGEKVTAAGLESSRS
jgi:hypothetical protein